MRADRAVKVMNLISRTMRAAGVPSAWQFGGMPRLILTTVDPAIGESSQVDWPSPVMLGDGYVVVADYTLGSRWTAPGWYRNLLADPVLLVEAQEKGKRRMRARAVTEDERAALWPQIVSAWPRYGEYQERIGHPSPVVVFEPLEGEGDRR